ncbi:TetR family transcriptional regulator [Sphaerisporangium dianthi]|uniref:TetR family transcriptional regulator n=1 Tax=Sphaerisporangium dianthi TaxID=1436120 RepID=A0ABV9CDB0_9ACTN
MVETPPDTRARILQVAQEEFAARGYHATSVREIAGRVGVTKTAVLYHFPGKADIVGALAAPMLDDLDAAVAAAAGLADPVAARWAVIEGLVEVWLAHRYLLRMNLYDLALAVENTIFHRFRDAMMRANALVAGSRPAFERQVRAAQAIAMLSDPVILFADAPAGDLRAAVLRGVHRLLDDAPDDDAPPPARDAVAGQEATAGTDGEAGRTGEGGAASAGAASAPAAGRARGRRGRPGVMSPAMARTARRMHAAGSTATEIAAALGVSRATVYRHLGGPAQ